MLAPDPGFVEIDGLDPHEFELALVELFELLGGVTEWCLDNPWRHGGTVFCRVHQARSQRRAS